MKQLLVAVIVLGAFVSVLDLSRASAPPIESAFPESVLKVEAVVTLPVTAVAYSVIDIESGVVVLEHNADQLLPIASVTKLFTAATVDMLSSAAVITITAADVATEGRAGKLQVGQSYTARELLFPLLLESSNDAAAALERNLGEVTLAGQILADASGLSSANTASAAVLASELRNVYLNHPRVFDITRLRQYVGAYTGWVNNSPVHDLPGYQGGKHGYTEAASKTLAAVFAESSLHDRKFGYVILGSQDIKADTNALRAMVERSVHLE